MRPFLRYKSSVLILGAALLLGTTAARAEVHQIGAVNVANDRFTNISWEHFEGAVEELQFAALGDTVDCAHISVTYRDGTTHKVYSGAIPKDGFTTVTFPEGDSRMRNVEFSCKAQSVDGARIALSAVSEGWDPKQWAREPHVTVIENGDVISDRGAIVTR
ncbi:MAG TPA: hypothetical protein VJS47_06395 [Rhizomicrobium sp.]|nr:hypothetical protein [Rhizomicrobium sp.]